MPTPGHHDDGLDEDENENENDSKQNSTQYLASKDSQENGQEQKEMSSEVIVTPASDVINR